MLKILHIITSLDKSAGDTVAIINYVTQMNKKKVKFDFACFKEVENSFASLVKSMGSKVFYIEKPRVFSVKKTLKQIVNILSKTKYDAVHLHISMMHGIVKKAMKQTQTQNLIVHSHSVKLSENFLKSARNKILCIGINKSANFRFACSKKAGQALFEKKFLSKPCDHVIKNAIDFEKFKFDPNVRTKKRKEFGFGKEKVLCHVGRFVDNKNQKFLIDIFSDMLNENKNLKLVLIGDGPTRSKLVSFCENSPKLKNKVIFFEKRNDISEIMQASDLFVFPSKHEGLGLVLVEAQATGLFCVASTGCPGESQISSSSVQFLPLNKGEWIKAISLEIKKKKTKRSSVYSEEYDINYKSKQLEKLYFSILKK